MSKLTVVVGGQLGSEAKGATAGFLARPENNVGDSVVGVRVGGPNAGHVVYGKCPNGEPGCCQCNPFGHPWKLQQVPVAAVTNRDAALYIADGSEVDFEILDREIRKLDRAGYEAGRRLFVSARATVLEPDHADQERVHGLNSRLGSTGKGVGAARADRVWRRARTVGDLTSESLVSLNVAETSRHLRQYLETNGVHVVVEGTQGYGLGLHTDNYPFTTSGDCRAIDFLSQAGINPWQNGVKRFRTVVVLRTRPIRVAGNSGPLRGETSWRELGLPEEHTTVTGKVRRVGDWDPELAREAVLANGGGDGNQYVSVALTMLDHEFPQVAGTSDTDRWPNEVWDRIEQVEKEVGCRVSLVGVGPTTMLKMGFL